MGEWAGKRTFDFICAFLGLVVLSPVLLAVALVIKLDSKGPVFFRQERVGKNGKIFKIFKFRTMVKDAPELGQNFTTPKGDPRITGVGRFLRKYYIDELAQMINVLVGEMSIVGPRPEVVEIVKLYDENQKKSLSVRPGLTDYGSLEFRKEGEILGGSTDLYKDYTEKILPEKIRLQINYIENQSFYTDMTIISKTIFSILRELF